MPTTIIKEIDNTSPGAREYSNFTVVVPGFLAPGADTSVFDDNGIYECASQTDFKTHVGKLQASASPLEAVVPTLKSLGVDTYKGVLTASEFAEYAGRIYLWHDWGVDPEEDGLLKCTEATATAGAQCLAGYYTLVAIADYDDAEANYCIIEAGDAGRDATSTYQLGNQIAYELLALGYTVLYKKLDNTTEFGDAKVTGIDALAEAAFWEPLLDRANYDFRYVLTGLLEENTGANEAISALCSFNNALPEVNGRGDCTALVDIDRLAYKNLTTTTQKEVIKAIRASANTLEKADKYTAIFVPTVHYDRVGDADYNYNNELPASFHYLACEAEASIIYREWYSIAGYTRGKNVDYPIARTSVILGDAAVNALSPRNTKLINGARELKHAVNVIAKTRKAYYLWGNRTAHLIEVLDEEAGTGELVASHFLNIRQLCTTIKKEAYVASRRHTFDPNSDALWLNWTNELIPTLDQMKSDQGIDDYYFTKKINTAKKATFGAILRIVPIESVEDFDLDLTLENSITGTTVTIVE